MTELIQRINYPELVFGLVAPIGAPITDTVSELKESLQRFGYDVHDIGISSLFDGIESYIKTGIDLHTDDVRQRAEHKIEFGNTIRKRFESNEVFASFAIQEIVRLRAKNAKHKDDPFYKNAYIIKQFKRPEEVQLLRSVYGQSFYQVSVYSKRSSRVTFLASDFAKKSRQGDILRYRGDAERLITEDENQKTEKFGQRVGKIFHDADVIISLDAENLSVSEQVKRFAALLFSSNDYTPTFVEYGMFAAQSAALRTSDLSRQVGAAVFSATKEIIALGSNEVPKAGGGTYWEDGDHDDREMCRKHDSNHERKIELRDEILAAVGTKYDELTDEQSRLVDESEFMDALEYGRIVHAEMNAISDAARIGSQLKHSTLFSTTFPCHMCAKHIIASGISKVIYLEPYFKSLAARLHSDSIRIEGQDRGDYDGFKAVEFQHFFGITPRRYRLFFEKGSRKDANGAFKQFQYNPPRPIIDVRLVTYGNLEEVVITELKRRIASIGANGQQA